MRYHSWMPRAEPPASGQNGAEIKALLESLKARIDATAVGILDGEHGRLQASSEDSKDSFWKPFDDTECIPTDWGDWDLELLTSAYARVDCLCGAHRVEAFTIHGRWILILLATGSPAIGAHNVIEHTMERLKQLLPESDIGRSPSAPTGGQPN